MIDMPEGEPAASRQVVQRRYAPKARSGCVTCKIRRIKCDETKPACLRCTRTGRKCDGYTRSKSTNTESSGNSSIHVALTIDVTYDSLERRTFDYFRSNTVQGVSGYFKDGVWNRLVLQISHTEPAVRYAANALGALHEETLLRRTMRQAGSCSDVACRTNFPAKQYTKAMNEVQKLLNSPTPPIEAILLCSMMFMHFEAINECFLSALLHLENGIQLVCSQSSSASRPIDSGVVQAIRRTDVQASLYLGMRIPGLTFYPDVSEPGLPLCFQDLTHARDVVNTWTCRLLHFVRTEADHYRFRNPGSVPLEILAKAQNLEQVSLNLDRLLYVFMQKRADRLTIKEQRGLDMLRARVKVDRVIAATCLYSEASASDIYLDVFKEILILCEYTMQNSEFDDWLFSVSLDEGLVSPLWLVINHCRDSHTRHRALALMKKLPSHEGIWYLAAMTQIGEACVQYEEALCEKESPLCADIPEHRRIHSSGLGGWDVTSPKTHAIAHLRTRPNGMDGEWCDMQESIELFVHRIPAVPAGSDHRFLSWKHGHNNDADNFMTRDGACTAKHERISANAETFETSPEWALHTEPWMARIPFQLLKVHKQRSGFEGDIN